MRYILLLSCCWLGSAQATGWDLIQKDLSEPFYAGFGISRGQLSVKSGTESKQGSLHIFTGYRFDKVWAVELSGYRLNEESQEQQGNELPFINIEHDKGVSLSLLGFAYYPEFSAYYRVGIQQDSYIHYELTNLEMPSCLLQGENYLCSEEKKQKSWLFGLGTEMPMSRMTALRLEWLTNWGGDDFEHHQATASLMVSF